MKQDQVWLNTSVFYNKESWHTLINDCLLPITTTLKGERSIEMFFLHFSKQQGDHIRVSILLNRENLDKVRELIQRKVATFISALPSITAPIQYPLPTIFTNFTNNTINFNIYKIYPLEVDIFAYKDVINVRELITKCVTEALLNEKIEEESIFTFALYMQVSMIKAHFLTKEDSLVALREILNNSLYNSELKEQIVADRKILDLYSENKELLGDIFREVWEENKDSKWLTHWIEKNQELISAFGFHVTYATLSHIVFEHICYKEPAGLYITSSLIYSCIMS